MFTADALDDLNAVTILGGLQKVDSGMRCDYLLICKANIHNDLYFSTAWPAWVR